MYRSNDRNSKYCKNISLYTRLRWKSSNMWLKMSSNYNCNSHRGHFTVMTPSATFSMHLCSYFQNKRLLPATHSKAADHRHRPAAPEGNTLVSSSYFSFNFPPSQSCLYVLSVFPLSSSSFLYNSPLCCFLPPPSSSVDFSSSSFLLISLH